jgi:hypothetical protein
MRNELLLVVALSVGCADRSLPVGTAQPLSVLPSASCQTSNPIDTGSYLTTDEGWLVHWPTTQGCIPVRYADALAAADALDAAVADWNALSCASLCLEAPTRGDAPAPAGREIFLDLDPAPKDEVFSQATLSYAEATGRITQARLLLNPAFPFDETNLFVVLGKAFGLQTQFAPGVDFGPIAQRFKNDVCALYGKPPRCGD